MAREKNIVQEYAEALLIALLAALFLRIFVVQAFRIPSGSMKDTLLVGDFLLVNKFIYGVRTPEYLPGGSVKIPYMRFPAFRKPQRGDVIVFKFPQDPKVDYIKRCIGLPGDTIAIKDNRVYINGEPEGPETFLGKKFDPQEHATYDYYTITLDNGNEYTIRRRRSKRHYKSEYGPVVVPPGHMFMMGDNRDNSADSRSWGFLPQDNIVGKATMIYFSFDKFRFNDLRNLFQAVRWNRIFDLIS